MSVAEPAARPAAAWRWALAFLLPASVLLVQLVASQRADPDLWGRISVGAVLLGTGHLPRADDFSFTASGAPWIDHEWLSGVAFYALLEAGGEPALQIFKYLMAASTLGIVLAVHRSAYRASPSWGAYALSLLSATYLALFLATVRAQVFSIVFFLAFLGVLERVRLRQWPRARLAWLLPVAVLWGNLHGGFAMGLLAIAAYGAAHALLGRRADALAHAGLAAGAILAVSLLNPYGPRFLAFLLHAWTLDRTGITEWDPMLARPWSTGTFVLALVAAFAAGLALRVVAQAFAQRAVWPMRNASHASAGAEHPLGPALVLLLVVCMALLARRIHSFMALALALHLPVLVPRLRRTHGPPRRAGLAAGVAVPLAACGLAALLLARVLPERPILRSFVPDEHSRVADRYRLPVGAVRYLRESPYSGRLLNPFSPGEFLYWTLYPKFRVAIDGRYEEVYTQGQFVWVRLFYGERDPRRIQSLALRSTADFVLLRSSSPARAALSASARWRIVYDDGVFALAGRRATLDAHPPFAFEPPRFREPPTIGSFFTASDRDRMAGYPPRGRHPAGLRPEPAGTRPSGP